MYFTLAIALYDIEQKHSADKAKGFKVLDKDIPVFTIFAFEEPENHLSPYYLGRVLKVLSSKSSTSKATAIVTSHSPSVVRRIEKVEQIRHFRQEISSTSRHSVVRKILMPPKKSEDDYKYINQAVLAHPELYFSKFVMLGEGDSEEIVISQLAEKLGFDVDPSFVAFVKLGGRHVNHMWRLLSDLDIPFLTLIDLDLGRKNAGQCRIEYAISELKKIGENFIFPPKTNAKDLNESYIDLVQIQKLLAELEKYGVYFSFPLDLDMSMIVAFPDCYRASNAQKSDRESLDNAVLGKGHDADEYDENGTEIYSDDELKKYRYLFCTKSKVASHYQAMSEILALSDSEIVNKCPTFIKRLIEKSSMLMHGNQED